MSTSRLIGTRLSAGYAVVLALTLGLAGLSLYGFSRQSATINDVIDGAEQIRQVTEWEGQVRLNLQRTLLLAVSGNTSDMQELLAPAIKETSARISALQKALDGSELSTDERELFDAVGKHRTAYVGARDKVFKALDAADAGGLSLVNSEMRPAADAYLASVTALVERLISNSRAHVEAARADAARGKALVVAMGLLALLVGGLAAWRMTRSVTRPLNHLVEEARAIAAGRLSRPVATDRHDELGLLQQALENMRQSLQGVVADIRRNTDGIATASSQIASGSQDLSQRTEQTAGRLQQAASSLTQLSGTVRSTADSATTANQMSATAAQAAARGGEVVGEVVEQMQRIADASRRIADIIGVIDGIAFQTNILALNAAVEAARAGEQGRGFAVVASEVRSLAGRSADAAREIKQLIGSSVERVEAGSRLAESAGSTMGEIVDSVRRVTDIIAEITAATAEQSSGIAQVNDAVAQLDGMTQQNAALVEQSAAAAESLRSQAGRLAAAVHSFQIEEQALTTLAPAAAPVRPAPPMVPRPRAPVAAVTPSAPATPAAAAPASAAATTAGDGDWETF
ncbi:MAG: HAMP domain-containing protein [Burkholderiales bacterium]|nr:HAMP domain-containing protein [Burkholderiales bacterium]